MEIFKAIFLKESVKIFNSRKRNNFQRSEGHSTQQTPALWGLHGQFMVQHYVDKTNNNLWPQNKIAKDSFVQGTQVFVGLELVNIFI